MRVFLIFLFCIFSFFSFGQISRKDSLIRALNFAKTDTAKLLLLIELEEDEKGYDTTYCKRAIYLAEKLIKNPSNSIKLLAKKAIAQTYSVLADHYDLEGKKDIAEEYLAKELKILLDIGDKKLIAEHYIYCSLFYSDNERIINVLNKSLSLYKGLNDKEGIALVKVKLGYINYQKGNIPLALNLYDEGISVYSELKDTSGTIEVLQELIDVYLSLNEYKIVSEYCNKLLLLSKSNYQDRADAYLRYGRLYSKQKNFYLSVLYYKIAIDILEKNNNKYATVISLSELGKTYKEQGDYNSSLDAMLKALNLIEEEQKAWKNNTNILEVVSGINNQMGEVYELNRDYKKALDFYNTSIKIRESIDHYYYGLRESYYSVAKFYKNQNQLSSALLYAKKALNISKAIKFPKDIEEHSKILYEIHKEQKNYKDALESYELYKQMHDSINNESIHKATLIQNFKGIREKQIAEQQLQNIIAEGKLNKQKNIVYSFIFVFCLLSFFIISILRSRKEIRRINIDVTKQKYLIEEKQKEILDSIHYSKRLQEAILPPLKFIDDHVPNNFVLYQPKDVVAGDFYWAETKDNKFFIAAADCTGHGVPGAMVSVVCSNALNRTVNEFGITDTGKILDKTRELVLETFAKGNAEVKDGMDISLLCIDKQNNKAFWSGANNPLWYVQLSRTEVNTSGTEALEVPVITVTSSEVEKSTDAGLDSARPDIQLIEIKADKQPIGKTDHAKPFTTHEIDLQEGMLFYLFTDGFADQFGGPKGKKFKYKQLEELLIANANKIMNEQHKILTQQFAFWKGDLEQVDDVCVIGVRV